MTGYTGPDDGKPLSPEFRKLFPPGVGAAGPGGTRQTTRIQPAPDRNGKRPPAKVTKPKPLPKRKKPGKPTPGGQAQPSRSKPQQGK